MQIPPSSAAASAASLTSQQAAKDRDATAAPSNQAANNQANDIHVDRSGASDPDRDAQGQGDGLGPRGRRRNASQSDNAGWEDSATDLPDEASSAPQQEAGGLDIVG